METLAITADAAWQCTATGAGRRLFTELAFDAPVVRQIEPPPPRVVEVRRLGPLRAAALEAPVVVEQLDAKLSQSGYTILNLLADLTQADSFRLRTREN